MTLTQSVYYMQLSSIVVFDPGSERESTIENRDQALEVLRTICPHHITYPVMCIKRDQHELGHKYR
jgi:hypothetical protein